MVKAGNAQGWGKFVESIIKEDEFGLGYTPGSQKNEVGTFSSGGLVSPHTVNAADEDKANIDCDLDSWIRPCVPGEKLDNWSSEKVVRFTLLKEQFLLFSFYHMHNKVLHFDQGVMTHL